MNPRSLKRSILVAIIAAIASAGGVLLAGGSHMTSTVAAEPPPAPAIARGPSHDFDFAARAENVVPAVV